MNNIIGRIEEIVAEQKSLLKRYTTEKEGCPTGTLNSSMNMGKRRFYLRYYDGGKRKSETLHDGDRMISELARKEYLKHIISDIERNILVLEKAKNNLKEYDLEEVIRKMPDAYRRLSSESFFDMENEMIALGLEGDDLARCNRHIGWASADYEKNQYGKEYLRFNTSIGIKVRSKSELMIAEELISNGIPFRYEQVLHIGGRIVVPDFSFEDEKCDPFYWEHAGMMMNTDYALRHNSKMKLYESAGIVPWRNLIVTYDNDGIVNLPMIKSIVKYEILPRL